MPSQHLLNNTDASSFRANESFGAGSLPNGETNSIMRNMHRRTLRQDDEEAYKQYAKENNSFCGSLSCPGILWAFLSVISMISSCIGYYLPYWIQGLLHNHISSIGIFRRCNYMNTKDVNHIEIVYECGHYSTFSDIPSEYWKVTTVLAGIGCALSLAVAFVALLSCCMKDILYRNMAKILGLIQLMAGIFIGTGCLIYPFGWENDDVRELCGPLAGIYYLGECRISWAYIATITGAGGLILSSMFSCCAAKKELRYSSDRTRAR